MDTININPFYKVKDANSPFTIYKELLSFEPEQGLDRVLDAFYGSADPASKYVCWYLVDRLFGFSSLFSLSNKLSKFLPFIDNDFPIKKDKIIDYLAPMYFVPDCINTDYYANMVIAIVNGTINLDLERLNKSRTLFGEINQPESTISEAEKDLLRGKQYLMFLASHYYPALCATFYVLVLDEYGNYTQKAKEGLVKYIETCAGGDETAVRARLTEYREKYNPTIAQNESGESTVKNPVGRPSRERLQAAEFAPQRLFNILFLCVQEELEYKERWKSRTAVDYTMDASNQEELLETILRLKLNYEALSNKSGQRNKAILRKLSEQ